MATEIKGLKISQISEVTKLTGNEMIPCEYGGTNGKFNASKLANYITENLDPYDPDGKIAQLENKVNNISGDVTNLETNVTNLGSDVDGLESKVTQNTENIGTLENQVTTNTGEIQDIKDRLDSVASKVITPDGEDLISEEKSEGLNVLKFADKAYNASEFSGIGRVYLRKNIFSNKNVLTQEMISEANTRYIVQYDYDLNGETITIPENCTLDFEGGSFYNGTINGTYSQISSIPNNIFHNVNIQGTFNIPQIYLSWFKLSDSNEDNIQELVNCIKLSNGNIFNTVFLNSKINIKLTASMSYVPVFSNTTICGGEIHLITDNLSSTYAIFETSKGNENITFDNIIIYGDALTNTNDEDVNIQFGHGIRVNGGKNITITNCYITECMGDGINIQVGSAGVEEQFPENIKIDKCVCNKNRRLGIAVEGGKNIIISNTECRLNGTINTLVFPGAGIDVEPWTSTNYIDNLTISNCILTDNQQNSICLYPVLSEKTTNIKFSGGVVDNILVRGNGTKIRVSDVTILKEVSGIDTNLELKNCFIGKHILLQESVRPCILDIINCDINISSEDVSYYYNSAIALYHQNKTALTLSGNKISITNSRISVSDLTNIYYLFGVIAGESNDYNIEIKGSEIYCPLNVAALYNISLLENCKVDLGSRSLTLNLKQSVRPMILRNCDFYSTREALILIGNANKNYTHKIDPYDVIVDTCSFNRNNQYEDGTSISTLIDLGYAIGGDTNYSVLFINPIFPKGISYNAYALSANKYYKLDWKLFGRDIETTNIDGTLTTKVFDSISNNAENRIYKINADIDLKEANTTLGNNCILDFTGGGAIKNGTLTLNNTLVLPMGCDINDYITATIDGTYKEGQVLYDSNLKKQKLYNGSSWVNLDGTTLI